MTTAEATAQPESGGLAGAFRDWWTDVKSGQLGSLPIIIGLIIIAIVFQSQNDRFLTASNFVNLIVQSAAFATIAMGSSPAVSTEASAWRSAATSMRPSASAGTGRTASSPSPSRRAEWVTEKWAA